jgi:hypothetical protein
MAGWTALYTAAGTSISTAEYSATLASTSGAPASKTDKGTICLVADVSALLAGDQFEIKLYDKARSGDTQRLVDHWVVTGAQAYPLFVTPPFMLGEGWDFTLKKITGTDRTIPCEVRAYT